MKVLLACGGTGGHVFPAISIADELSSLYNAEISFAGRADSMEENLIKDKYDFDYIQAVPLKRGKLISNLSLPYNLLKAYLSAVKVIKNRKPDFVVATGGYVSLPTILAAARRKIPIYLQEQNAVAGIANKIGAKFAKVIFVTSDAAIKQFPNSESINLGNPVRKVDKFDPNDIVEDIADDKKVVLVLGGSQGALGINKKLESLVDEFAKREDIVLIWQVGDRNFKEMLTKVGPRKNIFLKGFLNGIYAYIDRADVVISRAGASTLAELLAFGKPSILVPFPFATANHQEHNARALEIEEAALVELESEENNIWNKLISIIDDEKKIIKMQKAAESMGIKNAGELIARKIVELEGDK